MPRRLIRSTAIAMDSLYNARREFAIADARALTEAKVVNGTMVHGDLNGMSSFCPASILCPWPPGKTWRGSSAMAVCWSLWVPCRRTASRSSPARES